MMGAMGYGKMVPWETNIQNISKVFMTSVGQCSCTDFSVTARLEPVFLIKYGQRYG